VSARRVAVAVLSLAAGVAGLGLATIQATPAASAPVFVIGRAHAEVTPVLTGEDPIFILVLGSDARPGTAVDQGLCDSIHILGFNPAERRGSLVGIPRDSYVPLSTGGTNKINSAMPQGGPEAMVATVENLTGITFDYYALTGFDGVTTIVNAIGGLDIDVPYSFTGFQGTGFEAGEQTFSGAQALEFSRERKALSRGDFDRSMNQGRVLMAALAQFGKEFAQDPATLFRWLGIGLRNVQTDIPLSELMTLAFTASDIPPKRVTNMVTVGSIGSVNGLSIVRLPDPNPVFSDVAADGFVKPGDIPADAQPSG
jgi:polyisoprenyl-teichoic acid--peptidoglycan teichoic acid transferase